MSNEQVVFVQDVVLVVLEELFDLLVLGDGEVVVLPVTMSKDLAWQLL